MAEYINTESAYDIDTLDDWYINSVMPNDTPVWTEEHLEELLNDFYVIPKDTPAADVVEVVRCKDCKFRGREDCAMYYRCDCGERHTWETDNDFCSYGERKE